MIRHIVSEYTMARDKFLRHVEESLMPGVPEDYRDALRNSCEHFTRVAIGSYLVGVTKDGVLFAAYSDDDDEAVAKIGCPVEQAGLWEPHIRLCDLDQIQRFDDSVLDALGIPRRHPPPEPHIGHHPGARTVVVLNLE